MYNYESLSDVEFEALAQDVMSKMLGVELKRFAKGRDGGVDLTNDAHSREIIVQVKHYYRSSVSSLLTNLRKEIRNVEINKPNKYFVVTSATLSADKKDEIYQMFQDYMVDVNNVITREDIEGLLQSDDYIGVVKKHYKLWLQSTNILDLIFSADIEQDSLVCLTSIKENEKILVQTKAYFEAMKCLETSRILFLTGTPGVGKTITAQMLVLKYISEGYRLRFSTDTSDLNTLKKSLSLSRDTKEVILLDDCFGQYYFKMKSSQDSELTYLINLVKISPKKVLILNSRLTILNEAKSLSHELEKCFCSEDIHIHVIDMNRMSILDKAKILYNHLFFSDLPSEYFESVKAKNFYRDIINHKNYTPRIIEFITTRRNYTLVSSSDYPQYIRGVLDCPNEIWDNEYSQRIQQVDRIFLGTLFSLTDTIIDAELLQKCFNRRLIQSREIDQTVDNFRNCLTRLNMSMIRVIDDHSQMKIGVINPSVNDYLAYRLKNNEPEREAIFRSICSIEQAEKMIKDKEGFYKDIILDKSIFDFCFTSPRQKDDFICAQVCEHEILDIDYSILIKSYLRKFRMLINNHGYEIITQIEAWDKLLNTALYDFYNVAGILEEQDVLVNILDSFELDELIEAVSMLYDKSEETKDQTLIHILESNCNKAFKNAIDVYQYNLDIAAETEAYDIKQIIESNTEVDGEFGDYSCDVEGAAQELEQELTEDLYKKVNEKLTKLPIQIQKLLTDSWEIKLISSNFENVINAALEPDIDDYEDHGPSVDTMMDEIDYMFQR